jgi:rhodopsin domain-containing protein
MAGDQNYVTEEQITFTAYAMIIIASIFFFARLGLRLFKSVAFQLEDLFIWLAFLSFLALAIGYIVAAPVMFRVTNATSGMTPIYDTIFQDGDFMLKIFFANTLLLWCVLWAVKLSFLFLYRRLFVGLSGQIQWWWAVLVFTVIVLPPLSGNGLVCTGLIERVYMLFFRSLLAALFPTSLPARICMTTLLLVCHLKCCTCLWFPQWSIL